MHVKPLNDRGNLNELQVIESERNAIRKGMVFELLNAQDTVLCSYFVAERSHAGFLGQRGRSLARVGASGSCLGRWDDTVSNRNTMLTEGEKENLET